LSRKGSGIHSLLIQSDRALKHGSKRTSGCSDRQKIDTQQWWIYARKYVASAKVTRKEAKTN